MEDVTNDDDPGWQVEFGTSEAHLQAPARTFDSGIHTLVVEARDNSGSLTRMRYILSVVPIPQPEDLKPVLLIDDVPDKTSNGWPDNINRKKYDNDEYRDAFWSLVLDRVSGWSEGADLIDAEGNHRWGYREAVNYKVLLWTTRKSSVTYLAEEFISSSSNPNFLWLESYVRSIGNLFLVGSGATQNFYSNAMMLYPIIFDCTEGSMSCGIASYSLSFGSFTSQSGQVLPVGRYKFPYSVLGISSSSLTIPRKFLRDLNLCGDGDYHLTSRCGGTKPSSSIRPSRCSTWGPTPSRIRSSPGMRSTGRTLETKSRTSG